MINKYIRYFLGENGHKIGGLFMATGKLLRELYQNDSEYYDDINYYLSQIEFLIDAPDLDYNHSKYEFAFKQSFVNKKLTDLIDKLNYYLNLIDYEIIKEVITIDSDKIVYEDDKQIAYELHETLQAKPNKLFLEDPIDNLKPTAVAKYDSNGCLILPSSWDDDSDDDWEWLWDE